MGSLLSNKGTLRRNEEITSDFILLVERHGKVFIDPKLFKRSSVKIDKGDNLVEIDTMNDGEISVCGIFKDDLAKFNMLNVLKVADSVGFIAKEKAGLLATHEKEQFQYRKTVCKPCLDNGSCLVCGCSTPGRMYSRAACAGGKYPKLLNEKEWEEHKSLRDPIKSQVATPLLESGERDLLNKEAGTNVL